MSESVFCHDFTCKHLDPGDSCKLVDFLIDDDERLRELVRDFDKCLDTALYLADSAGYLTMPDQKLFASLRQRMRELGIEVEP